MLIHFVFLILIYYITLIRFCVAIWIHIDWVMQNKKRIHGTLYTTHTFFIRFIHFTRMNEKGLPSENLMSHFSFEDFYFIKALALSL